MAIRFSVPMSKIIKNFNLETLYSPDNNFEFPIQTADINRPGLELCGYLEYFDQDRLQILGKTEISYISTLPSEERHHKLNEFVSRKPPAIIISRGLDLPQEMLLCAMEHKVPIFRTQDSTSSFIAGLISRLNVELAPRITRHGVLVEVYGEGILLLGESGVGKSETAIELIKRGHRLIADDSVELRRVSEKTIVGKSPDNIRYFSELRGIGIVNVKQLFGVGSINITERVELVVHLEEWDSNKSYSKIGMGTETTNILGLEIPMITIPVRPGRNLAVILEVAAMNFRNLKLGYDPEQELLDNLGLVK